MSDVGHYRLQTDDRDEIWIVTSTGKSSRIHSLNGYVGGEHIKNALLRAGVSCNIVTSLPERHSND